MKGYFVFDSNWNLFADTKPSVEDIRQMYAYHHYFKSDKVALVYPRDFITVSGKYVYIDNQKEDSSLECSLMFIQVVQKIKKWQEKIGEKVKIWMG